MISLTTPIPFRLRSDLEWFLYPQGAITHWVASDPVQQEFYFLSELEQRIARAIDGNATVQSILQAERHEVNAGFLSQESIIDLVTRLHQNSLLLPLDPTQVIRVQENSYGMQRAFQVVSYLLALRIPLFNPDILLEYLRPLGNFLFSRQTRWLCFVFAAFGLSVAVFHWQAFLLDAESFNSTLRGDRLWMTLLLVVGIKVLHELGHGLACQHFGGRCHEMGVVFLFGIPSMYCDVTDSWKLPNRWSRIAIAGGGIYVEICLATLACFLWVSSDSPMIRGVAVQVMIVSSLMTVLLNANPLLRYDGYYILSDLVNIPNLADECRKVWRAAWGAIFLKSRLRPLRSRQNWDIRSLGMLAYHILSMIYRWTLLFTITWFVITWLDHNGLSSVAESFKWLAISSVCLVFLNSCRVVLRRLIRVPDLNLYRIAIAASALACLGWFLFFYPMPTGIVARGYLEPDGFKSVFARRNAVLVESPKDGQKVKQGDLLFKLKAIDLELEILQTRGEMETAEARVTQLQQRLVNDPKSAQQILETSQLLDGLKDKLVELTNEESKLTILADSSGVFIDSFQSDVDRNFTATQNEPMRMDLATKTQGGDSVARGELIGWIGTDDFWVVNAFVREQDLLRIAVGSECLIRADQFPEKNLKGRIQAIAPESLTQTPDILKGDSLFTSFTRSTSESIPEETTFSVVVSLGKLDRKLFTYGLASVRIQTPKQTIASQIFEKLVPLFETLNR